MATKKVSSKRPYSSGADDLEDRTVFVVHGRNLEARNSLFRFLRSIGLRPLEWSQAIQGTRKASPFIGQILDVAFSKARAVVVLLTPDDEARLREPFRSRSDPPYESQMIGQARPNVLFEAGMAMGHDPDRTILVELGSVRPFSDIAGRHIVRLTNDSSARQELVERLRTAGCLVDISGRDWHTEGDFSIPIDEANSPPPAQGSTASGARQQVVDDPIPTEPPPPADNIYDENDVISMIAAWLRLKKVSYQGFMVTYTEVDRELGFKSGTAQKHIKAAISDLGLHIDREGKNTITVRRRPVIA